MCVPLFTPSDGIAQVRPDPHVTGGAVFYQPKTHVSGGGDIAVSRYALWTGFSVPVNKELSLRFTLDYEFDNYNFSRLSRFAVPDPWNRINRVGFSPRVAYRVSPEWTLFAAPVGQYAGEQGADFNDSLLYGGTVGAVYTPGRDFMIGFGPGVFYRLEETRFFPALIFAWRITDRLRLGNSFRTGPAGPAGLELAYALDRNWEAAISGGYRSYRFRLDRNGPAPGGIGQTDSWPAVARISRTFGPLRADLYGGAAFGGRLRLEDRSGRRIDQVSYNTAPLAGLALSLHY
jgi:hypothetical protein